MEKIIFALTAFMGLCLVSCDETTINPTNEKNNTLSQVDILTSTLWERKYFENHSTTMGNVSNTYTTRTEFNVGLIQKTYNIYYAKDGTFNYNFVYHRDKGTWSIVNDTLMKISNNTTDERKYMILKLDKDSLILKAIPIPKLYTDSSIYNYHKVNL